LDGNGPALAATAPAGARKYVLVCPSCGRRQEDDGLILECPAGHEPALLRTEYAQRCFQPCPGRPGIFRYREWLPVIRAPADAGASSVYQSKGLASVVGLPNLWIAFNGYWPERGAGLQTGTFKEFEAYTVLGRLPEGAGVLTVASSGNTAAAFALACSQEQIPCLLIIPAQGLARLKFREPLNPCVCLVVIEGGEYPDAMDLVASVSGAPAFQDEGGVRNVGRRDGLATVLLSAFEQMQRLPTHYFQAAGSGTGAIAVLEAAKRVRAAAGHEALPRLMLCQNLPFAPIYDAWRTGRRLAAGGPSRRYRRAIAQIHASELTNWAPPYGITGGVYDALMESGGDVLVAANSSVRAAMKMFLELEGIDIEPAAGVAVACLLDAAAKEKFGRESVVLLNITGGGRRRLAHDCRLVPAQPHLRFARDSPEWREAARIVTALCAATAR
jgi:cysteate synthase